MIARYIRMDSLRAAGLRLIIFRILNTRPERRTPLSYSCFTIPSASCGSTILIKAISIPPVPIDENPGPYVLHN